MLTLRFGGAKPEVWRRQTPSFAPPNFLLVEEEADGAGGAAWNGGAQGVRQERDTAPRANTARYYSVLSSLSREASQTTFFVEPQQIFRPSGRNQVIAYSPKRFDRRLCLPDTGRLSPNRSCRRGVFRCPLSTPSGVPVCGSAQYCLSPGRLACTIWGNCQVSTDVRPGPPGTIASWYASR